MLNAYPAPVQQDPARASQAGDSLPSPAIGEIAQMVERRDQAVALLDRALELIIEARRVAPPYGLNSALRKISWHGDEESVRREKRALVKAVDRACWEELLDTTRLGIVMNGKQLEACRKDIKNDAPELTLGIAMTTFMDLYVRQEDTFREGLVASFKVLSGKYRSHSAFKIQRRTIIQDGVRSRSDCFNDMWKYLVMLDGINPAEIPHDDQPINVIKRDRTYGATEFDFKQFRAVVYQNGNIHVWLDTRPDLLERVNDLIAEHYGLTFPRG